MQQKLTELRCKEIINICDGNRLGYVCDVMVELPSGCIAALIVPGPCRCGGLLGREYDYCIPWNCVCRIGDDTILVDVCLDQVHLPCGKKQWFG